MCLLAPESQFTVENACCNFMRPLELSSTLCAGQKKREKAIFIYYLLFFFCFQTRPWLPLFYRKGHGPNAKRGKSSCLAGFKVSDPESSEDFGMICTAQFWSYICETVLLSLGGSSFTLWSNLGSSLVLAHWWRTAVLSVPGEWCALLNQTPALSFANPTLIQRIKRMDGRMDIE